MSARFSQSDIVESEPGVTETFMVLYSNISRSTAGNSVMSAAGLVRNCVGIGCDKERES